MAGASSLAFSFSLSPSGSCIGARGTGLRSVRRSSSSSARSRASSACTARASPGSTPSSAPDDVRSPPDRSCEPKSAKVENTALSAAIPIATWTVPGVCIATPLPGSRRRPARGSESSPRRPIGIHAPDPRGWIERADYFERRRRPSEARATLRALHEKEESIQLASGRGTLRWPSFSPATMLHSAPVVSDRASTAVRARLQPAKAAFTTRRVPAADLAHLVSDRAPRAGDLVLAVVETIGQHDGLQLCSGRRAHIHEGDEVLVCY